MYYTSPQMMTVDERTVFLISPKFNWMHGDIPYPPLAAAYLSATTNQIGVKTILADGTFPEDYQKTIGCICAQKGPILVGISSTFLQLGEALSVARRIKQSNPSSLIVIGGAGPNCLPVDTFSQAAGKSVDIISVGESESTWKEIVEMFFKYKNSRQLLNKYIGVKGTILLNPKILINPPREFLKDLDSLPIPDLDIINARRYIETWKKNGGMGSISLFPSRGCPFSCIFCDKTIFGRGFRVHSPKRIVDEIERILTHYGPVDDIFFFDDNLTTDRRVMQAVCQEIIDRGLKPGWSCQARMNTVDEETLSLMKQSGCTDVFFGLESTSPRLLKYLNKGITIEKAKEAISLCKKTGLRPGVFLLTGIPGETPEDAQIMEDFILETKPSYIGFSVLLPFPGTELYRRTQHQIRPELQITPELLNDPSRLKIWDDTRTSVYLPGTFSTDPRDTINRIETKFKNMVETEGINYDPSQFVIDR